MRSCKPNQFLLLVTLILPLIDLSIQCFAKGPSVPDPSPEQLMRIYPIKRALYEGDSIKEFLQLCEGKPRVELRDLVKLVNNKKEKILNLDVAQAPSDCFYNLAENTKFTKGELFRLQYGQKKIREQQNYILNLPRGIFSVLLFSFVLAMLIFLVVKGHFKTSTLPLIGRKNQQDPTDGVKFDQYVWMRFLVLDKKSWLFRGRDLSKYDWFTYHKWDHHFNIKDIGTATRFKFLERKFINNLSEDEFKSRKKNLKKQNGWDFEARDRGSDTVEVVEDIGDIEVITTDEFKDQTKNIYNT